MTATERLDILCRRQEGQSPTEIAKSYGIARQTVYDIEKKANKYGVTEDRPRSGRPRKTNPRDDHQIILTSLRSPKKTPLLIKRDLNLSVDRRTVRRRMNERGLRPHIAATVSYVSDINRKRRLALAKVMVKKPSWWFRRIIWSDEKKFELMSSKRRIIVNRRPGNRYQIKFTKPSMKFGGGSLMIWGCFSYKGVGSLAICEHTMDQKKYRHLLEDHLQYSANLMGLGCDFVFQQDHARIHTAPRVQEFFSENNIEVMRWSPQSPDFNPIENLWHYLDVRVPVTERVNKNRFWSALQKTWDEIPLDYLQNLVDSVPMRFQKAIECRGYPTGY